MGLKTQCEAEGDEDKEGKRMFFGRHVPSLLFFKPPFWRERGKKKEVGHLDGADSSNAGI